MAGTLEIAIVVKRVKLGRTAIPAAISTTELVLLR
jgi:hypothetical protein